MKKRWPKVKWISSAHRHRKPWNVVCYEFLLHPFLGFGLGLAFSPISPFVFLVFLVAREAGRKHIRKQFVHAPIRFYFSQLFVAATR